MNSDVITRTQLAAILTAYLATLTSLQVHLFTNANFTPNLDTTLATYTEPVGTWYGAANLTMGTVFDDPTGNMYAVAKSVQFDYNGTSAGETIHGWYLTANIANVTTLISAGLLANAVTLQNSLDAVVVQPTFVMPPF